MADGDDELARLRTRPDNVHLLGGFGPLVVGVVLFLLIVFLAPTIAPEQVVELPVHATTTIVTTTTSVTTTTVTTVAP